MSNRVIILGCGRQGARLAELLQAERYDVNVIDMKQSSFARLHDFHGKRIIGNGIDEEILRRAGIEDAYAFAAVTNGDNTNLMSAQIAKTIFEVPHVVCRVYDPARAGIYHDLGLDTVSATTVGARMIRNLIIAPKVLRQYQMGDGTAMAVEFKLGEAAAGRTLAEMEVPNEFRLSAVMRDQTPIIPDADYVSRENDHVFGAVLASSLPRIQSMLQIEEHAVNFPSRGGVF
jgi:trk system potassium uptake protein TrkA